MSTIQYSDYLPSILVDVPGCPDVAVERDVRNAAIDFCRRSLAWRKQLAPIAVVALTNTYALVGSIAGSRVIKVHDAILTSANGDVTSLLSKTPQALDAADPRWRTAQSNVNTGWFTQDEPDSIILAGMPQYDGTLTVLAAFAPTLVSTGFDGWIGEQYFEAIIHGAKARILAAPQKPWSNPQLAIWHEAKFDLAISEARIEAANAYQSDAPIRTTGQYK